MARFGGGKARSRALRSSASSLTSTARALALHVLRLGRFRDGDDAGPLDQRRQRDRCRRAPVLACDRAERRIAQQRPLAERRVGHDHDVRLPGLRQQPPFDAALAEVIEHLVRDAVAALRHTGEFVPCRRRRNSTRPRRGSCRRASASRTPRPSRRAACGRASAADRDRGGRSAAVSGCARRRRSCRCARRCADRPC